MRLRSWYRLRTLVLIMQLHIGMNRLPVDTHMYTQVCSKVQGFMCTVTDLMFTIFR